LLQTELELADHLYMRHIRFHEHIALPAKTLAQIKLLSAALGMQQYFRVPTLASRVHQSRQDLVA
jgi:hypothetical protein